MIRAALLLALLALPQESGVVAITNVRIIPVTQKEITSGTILIKGGKIAEVGKDVKVPGDARVVDAKGLVAFPGFVHPVSRAGAGRSVARSSGTTPEYSAADDLNPALESYDRIARCGITSYGFVPYGGPVAGRGAVVKPVEGSKARKVRVSSAFLKINMRADTATKQAIKGAFEAARKQIEAEKKAAEAKKKKVKGAKPAPKANEKTRIMMSVLKGELPAVVTVSSAADLLHFWQIMEGFGGFKPRLTFEAPPEAYKAASELGKRKARVILKPGVAYLPLTRDRVNPAAEIARAGGTVALAPDSDSGSALEAYRFRLSQLVKYGLDRELAYRAVTIAAAEALGAAKSVGSIEKGKDADLIVFTGDPLDPASEIRSVWVDGVKIYSGE